MANRFVVTADVVWLTIRNGRLSVMLVDAGRGSHQSRWSLPSGSVKARESLVDAAERNLIGRLSLADLPPGMRLEQLATYGHPDRTPAPRAVSVAHLAFSARAPEPATSIGSAIARWWAVDELDDEGVELVLDHDTILSDGIARARSKLTYTNYALAFVTAPFTLSELRSVYESVWSVPLDPSNFRRSVENNPGFVEAIGPSPTAGRGRPGRPAMLYRPGSSEILVRPIEPRGDGATG
jgi:8-oxo-dGTP diphosphatase